ncbi:MAG: Ni/Fe-hydrogenase, b-type cytochrome subunit [Planctomycetota bacterium]|jgi:Ni/Fe-hydrogenase 1 B-type cytochrome subunit
MAQTIATADVPRPRFERIYVWERPIRIFHWVNALCVLVLFLTGLYIASPILSSTGEPWANFLMARIRQIHFIAAAIFVGVFILRIYWFWAGNEHARSGFPYVWRPAWWKDLVRQALDYLRLDFGRPHVGHNALGGLSYTVFVILVGWLQILTGMALYAEVEPDGFWGSLMGWVIPLFGGSFRTHMWHHMFAWVFIWFAILHVYIVILDSRQYRNGLIGSMITGMKFRRERPAEHDE